MFNNWTSRVFLSCMMFTALVANAHADDYPVRRITLVAPYAAGGGFDGVTCILAEALARNWDRPLSWRTSKAVAASSAPGRWRTLPLTATRFS